ncbi:MAG: chemotaxis protein CheW [Actinomycetota bacterium]|jgi:purine-binding chemotaxis protein CheW|nr:chemotaxis protein CheW [Actinomycetota bacterium]
MGADRQLCTFVVGGLHLGVGVEHVAEVLRPQQTTAVPLAHEEVAGLINLRGEIVTALDLRRRLGLEAAGEEPQMNVVLTMGEEAVSLLVDEIGEVVTVSEDDFEPPPETVAGPTRELILGAFKLDERLLLLLDTERALAPSSA